MKRQPLTWTLAERGADAQKRRGAVLIVVLLLMILLLFLGITWYTFASTEQNSALYFAEAGKVSYSEVTLDADVVFDFALEQLILGTRRSQSALYPGQYSLVPNLIGRLNSSGQPTDRHPFSGRGVNIISSSNGAPLIDQDHDNTADGDQSLLNINLSGAGLGYALNQTAIDALPQPDVDYTYPDYNNPYLAYSGTVSGKLVTIPSFHRPLLLRDSATGAPINDWYNNTDPTKAIGRKVFRPHPSHLIVGTAAPRFLSSATTVGAITVNPFPFAVDANANSVYGEQGVWTNPSNPTNLDYDVDTDGDGVRDAVWLDLDFPKQTLPDGRSYVSLIAFQVRDLDGLINLNTAGNLPPQMDTAYPGTIDPQTRLSFNLPFGGGQSISASNLGLSPTEINPTWALIADPTATGIPTYFADSTAALAAKQQLRGFFTGNPVSALETANMELLSLILGRPQYNVSGSYPTESFSMNEAYEGRWGELTALISGANSASRNPRLFPRPGQQRATSTSTQAAITPLDAGDDDGNRYLGRSQNDLGQWLTLDALLPGIILPSFVHPLDFGHRGSFVQTGTHGPVAVPQGDPADNTNPSRWLKYTGYQGQVAYDSTLTGQALTANTSIYQNVDDGDEVIVDLNHKQSNDKVLGADEIAALHLAQADYTKSGASSRLRKLLSINFDSNLQAAAIRQRFTTQSQDRRQHNFFQSVRRPWEYNADVNGNGKLEFPPAFVTAGANSTFVNSLGQTLSKEPFRAEVAAQLGSELNDDGTALLQRQLRLQANRLCIIDDTHLQTTNSQYRRDQLSSATIPRFRNLMPHAPLTGGTDNTAIPTTAPFPPTTGAQQEFWARIDRQRLARDIYVLLYTLGGGQDGLAYDATKGANYADVSPSNLDDNSGRAIYSDAQLQVMAQFAVNYVDALDRDNVITKFEYDRNLGDGWNLGDNPYSTADDDPSMPSGDRGVVYGVEAQLLTFSEVLAFLSKKDPSGTTDYPCTTLDDKNQDHPYAYIELRSTSPFTVAWSNSSWRIRRVPSSALTPALQPLVERQLVLKQASIAPGAQFTIGTQDGTDKFIDPNDGSTEIYRSSDFRVDYDLDADFDRIVPNRTETTPPQVQTTPTPAPGCDLDLVHARDQSNRFSLQDGAGTTIRRGGFVFDGTNPVEPAPAENDNFTLVLERRVHLSRTAPTSGNSGQEADNPWIEVDRIVQNGGLKKFEPDSSTTNIETSLAGLRSTERAQPFDRSSESVHASGNAGTGWRSSSINQNTTIGGLLANSNTTSAYTRWQPHFDRDFSSVIELLSLPLYGPDQVTSKLGPDGANSASALILRPQDPSNDGQPVASQDPSKNNRWYRLLEALEVPPRMHQQLEQAQQASLNAQGLATLPRTPGRLNINAIRHLEVLGALLDDSMISRGTLADVSEATRNWWDQFLRARDRRDPTTGLILPGSPASRPFRGYAFTEEGIASLDSTLLRRLTWDHEDVNRNGALDPGEDADNDATLSNHLTPSTAEPRRLFEARMDTDVANNTVDFYTRNRLLSKISGNTTTKSNLFAVWITVGFFQAAEGTPGQVQIGAELSGAARYRGFFVVDRSDLERAFNTTSRQFDFRKFVLHRQTLN